MDSGLTEQAQALIGPAMAKRGLIVEPFRSGWLVGRGGIEAVVECSVHDKRRREPVVSVELRVEIMPRLAEETRSIRDVLVGHGSTDVEAIADAIEVWAEGVLEPAHRAVLQVNAPPDAIWGSPDAPDEPWSVYLGPMQVAGLGTEVHAQWDGDLPFNLLAGKMHERLVQRRSHWIKVFVAALDSEILGVECRFDNEPWPDGEEIIRRFSWPQTKGYFAFKRFIALRPS